MLLEGLCMLGVVYLVLERAQRGKRWWWPVGPVHYGARTMLSLGHAIRYASEIHYVDLSISKHTHIGVQWEWPTPVHHSL